MAKTFNILGDTQREQWTSAVNIMSFAVEGNIMYVRDELRDKELVEMLDKAVSLLGLFREEMLHLVEGVFDE